MAPRGAKIADIKTVESHVHALGQCRRIIRKLGIKPIVAGELPATRASLPNVATRAVPRSPRSSRPRFTVSIFWPGVEDESHNTTRFVVLAREPPGPNKARAR